MLMIASNIESDEDENKYVRRERSFSCSRSYYVGDAITEEDIKAKYDNGTLVLVVPKKEKQLPKKKINTCSGGCAYCRGCGK